jgi:hypothetical protein
MARGRGGLRPWHGSEWGIELVIMIGCNTPVKYCASWVHPAKRYTCPTCWCLGGEVRWGELASPLKVSALLEWRLSFLRRIIQLVNLLNDHLYRERTVSYMLLRKCIFQRVFFFFLSHLSTMYVSTIRKAICDWTEDWIKAGKEERVDSLFVQMEFMPFTSPSLISEREWEWERKSESRERTAFEEEHQNSLLFPSHTHTYICMPVGVHLAARMSAPHALLMEFNKWCFYSRFQLNEIEK